MSRWAVGNGRSGTVRHSSHSAAAIAEQTAPSSMLPPHRRPAVHIPPAKKVFAPANLRAQADNVAYRQLVLRWMEERVRSGRRLVCGMGAGAPASCCWPYPAAAPPLAQLPGSCVVPWSTLSHQVLPCSTPSLPRSTPCATAAAWCQTCTTSWPRWAIELVLVFHAAFA